MPLTFLLDGVDITPSLFPANPVPDKGSFSWTERLGSRNTGTVRFIQSKDIARPRHGQSIVVIKGGSYFDEVLRDLPLAYWRLDELSGSIAADRSGHGFAGTYTGTVTLGQESLIRDSVVSVDFVSGGGRVLLGVVPAFSPAGPFTIEAIIKPLRVQTALGSYDIFSNETISASGIEFSLNVHATDGTVRLIGRTNQAGSNTAILGAYSSALGLDQIAHVAWTYDGVNGRLYLNGALVGGPTAMPLPVQATAQSAIGGNTSSFNGQMDEVAFYDSALSADRIAAHYAAMAAQGRVFGGRLRQPTRSMRGITHMAVDCGLVDFSEALDRRIVVAVYENKTLKEIVDDINTNFLNGEGILTNGVEVGPTISRIVFNYKNAAWCFNELTRRTGYAHWMDYANVLHFKSRTSYTSPIDISYANAHAFSVTEQAENYRNVQYLKAGVDLTDPRDEDFEGDGTQTTFSVGFPIGKVPVITENIAGGGFGAPKLVGIKGVEIGKDWYWNKGDNSVTQDSAGTPLTAADVLRVTYQGQFPITVNLTDDDEIADRADVEGTSGRYEHLDEDRTIDDSDVAFEKVEALLERFGMIADTVVFTTMEDGLRAGQLCSIDHPYLGVNSTFLIESVSGSIKSPDMFSYMVKAIGGNDFGAWQEFFIKLVQLADQDSDIADVLQLLQNKTDSTASNDNPSDVSAAPESRIGFAIVGFSEIA